MVGSYTIHLTEKAKENLRQIYNYYKEQSEQGAKNVIKDIIKKIRTLHYPEQYQRDEIAPDFRRMIVRHYKILYTYENKTINIHRIFDVRQDPSKQK